MTNNIQAKYRDLQEESCNEGKEQAPFPIGGRITRRRIKDQEPQTKKGM